MQRFLIIGGSDAGISAALRARELNREVELTLVVADRYPNFSIRGIPYFLSGEVASADDLAHRKAADIEAHGIRLLLEHRAVRIDPERRRVDVCGLDGETETLPYDKLLIGTGAVSVRPNLPGIDLPGVFPLRWMGDTLALEDFPRTRAPRLAHQRALIIGGGYIGMEMSEALTRRGLNVTVVEAMPSVLTTVDPDLGARVGAELGRHGVEGIDADGDALAVHGSGGLARRVDLVLVVIVAAALHHGMTVEDLSDLDLSYTPPLSSPWDPVQMAAQAWVKAWRSAGGEV